MEVSIIEDRGGDLGKNFDPVKQGDVVILPAFGASVPELRLLSDRKVQVRLAQAERSAAEGLGTGLLRLCCFQVCTLLSISAVGPACSSHACSFTTTCAPAHRPLHPRGHASLKSTAVRCLGPAWPSCAC